MATFLYESYYGVLPIQTDVIKHYQVKGAKHGVRRWQNYDGSLTPAGRDHYNVGPPRGSAQNKARTDVGSGRDLESVMRSINYKDRAGKKLTNNEISLIEAYTDDWPASTVRKALKEVNKERGNTGASFLLKKLGSDFKDFSRDVAEGREISRVEREEAKAERAQFKAERKAEKAAEKEAKKQAKEQAERDKEQKAINEIIARADLDEITKNISRLSTEQLDAAMKRIDLTKKMSELNATRLAKESEAARAKLTDEAAMAKSKAEIAENEKKETEYKIAQEKALKDKEAAEKAEKKEKWDRRFDFLKSGLDKIGGNDKNAQALREAGNKKINELLLEKMSSNLRKNYEDLSKTLRGEKLVKALRKEAGIDLGLENVRTASQVAKEGGKNAVDRLKKAFEKTPEKEAAKAEKKEKREAEKQSKREQEIADARTKEQAKRNEEKAKLEEISKKASVSGRTADEAREIEKAIQSGDQSRISKFASKMTSSEKMRARASSREREIKEVQQRIEANKKALEEAKKKASSAPVKKMTQAQMDELKKKIKARNGYT